MRRSWNALLLWLRETQVWGQVGPLPENLELAPADAEIRRRSKLPLAG